ncbi:hypothetical protein HPB48_021318 [Haemaphysalis longicornis]|uniref:Uncharacterized protein n=1 Tax=Haemaphysalis longicornis TaxID=44386 RepID=A0A9J6GP15_HAELO|nr:hypothetical protein HPB48_021318 [Haemaphysalis longicornis]
MDQPLGKVSTELWELPEVPAANGMAENVFSALSECFEKKGIPLKNIIGLGCDNTSIMVGKHNSIMTCLMKMNKHLTVIRCTCTSAHLAGSTAAVCLLRTLEEMLHSTVNYVSGSAKRCPMTLEILKLFRMQTT